ncbi:MULTISPECIES: hypothetical protein [unclassified Sphingomonas]|uniref:hypothetical protein n=1 Tax=unclassified Sphingomonas TaxID=196159 RepID=UPI000A53A7E1|nr:MULTISPECIES: hypothetical protein [unclassified Sphingomonas]
MASTPQEKEPGFETDVNELPEDDKGSEDTLEEEPLPEDEATAGMEEAQEQAAEERKEGGYQ